MTATSSKHAPAQLPSLPSVDDSSWASAAGGGSSNIQRLLRYVTAGRPVWWRRGLFRLNEGFPRAEPKWHVFAGRTRSGDPATRWSFTWTALCSYTNVRSEILSGLNEFQVGAPTKDTRCIRCDTALKAIKKNASR